MLKLNNIAKVYNQGQINETKIFDNFNLEIQDGEFISVIGSNGSGKTTLLNIITGDTDIQKVDILFKDINLTKLKDYERYRYINTR